MGQKNQFLPPRWANHLLEWFCAAEVLETLQGDLYELYEKRLQASGKFVADLYFILDVISVFRPFALKRTSAKYLHSTPNFMLPHYFTIASRYLLKYKAYSLIHITGLSLGLACCMLIFLYTKDEISYDKFHQKADQIHQLTYTFINLYNQETNHISSTNLSAGEGFQKEIPEIEAIVRISQGSGLIMKENEIVREDYFYVDPAFFSVFSFPLLYGEATTALLDEHSIVVTEKIALKYYNTINIVGKELRISDGKESKSYIVSAVAKNPPENSSLKFNMLLPFALYKKSRQVGLDDWFSGYLNTFLVLHPGANPQVVEAKFEAVLDKYAGQTLKQLSKEHNIQAKITYGLLPLEEIHMQQTFKGGNGISDTSHPMYSYLLSGLAFFILCIACCNLVNLALAQSFQRAREIGIRKTYGGNRKQLMWQFLGESFLICLFAYLLAVVFVYVALPFFNELANKKLSFSYLLDGQLIGAYLLLLLITAISAGMYPAVVLSGFNPVKILAGRQKLSGKHTFAKSLVVIQFALASLLIIGTLTIYSQIEYLLTSELGYEDENLIRISLPEESDGKVEVLKNEWKKHAAIENVSAKSAGYSYRLARVAGKDINTFDFKVDPYYLSTLGIKLKEGRDFSWAFAADSLQSVLINEAFAREAGWGEKAIGERIKLIESDQLYTVVGVVKDYHFRPLRDKLEPLVLHMLPRQRYGELLIKVKPDDLPSTLAFLEKSYKGLYPLQPFAYEFAESINARAYQTEQRWKQMMGCATILAVVISCIGLFGLAAVSIHQRTREIGIRKVLGASMGSIVALLSQSFVALVSLAVAIAVPLGIYGSQKWLDNFAYRVEINWWALLGVGVLCLLIPFLTISMLTIRAARANPVEALRTQ